LSHGFRLHFGFRAQSGNGLYRSAGHHGGRAADHRSGKTSGNKRLEYENWKIMIRKLDAWVRNPNSDTQNFFEKDESDSLSSTQYNPSCINLQ
jgi:hypothetical protein